MANTESTMIPLGTLAPDFKLMDTNSNDEFTFADVKGEKEPLSFSFAITVRLCIMSWKKLS